MNTLYLFNLFLVCLYYVSLALYIKHKVSADIADIEFYPGQMNADHAAGVRWKKMLRTRGGLGSVV